MADAVPHMMRRIGADTMAEGDVYLTNDPWEGTGHLHDITVVHARLPGGPPRGLLRLHGAYHRHRRGAASAPMPTASSRRGLRFPAMRLFDGRRRDAEGGPAVDATLLALIRANTRQPDQLIGDLHALATCNRIGDARLQATMDEFALADLDAIADHVLTASRDATLDRIRALPPGEAEGHMRIDGYGEPVDLRVRVRIGPDGVHADWTGTSGIDPKGINVPLVYTKAYAGYALKCAIAPDVPNNAGALEPFTTSAPDGAIVNARDPAPVALRHVIGHMVPDAVFGALDRLLPGRVPAEGAGCLCNFMLSTRPVAGGGEGEGGGGAEVLAFNSGGSGARPALDGLSATAFPSGVMTMPVEATEQAGPVLVHRKELRPDSGGAGRHRGGLGQCMDVGARSGHRADFQAMLDRVRHPARGRNGGGPGGATVVERHGPDGAAHPMRGMGKQAVPDGHVVRMRFPGGGGIGAPTDRDRAALARDLAHGYVTPEAARDAYGAEDGWIRGVLERAERGEAFP